MTDLLLSPELALVDPELALAARASLPQPGCFRPGYLTLGSAPPEAPLRVVAPVRVAAAAATIPVAPDLARRPRRRTLVLAGVAVVLAAIAAGAPATTWPFRAEAASPHESPTPRSTGTPVSPAVATSHTNTWPVVPGVLAYDIDLARDGVLVYHTSTPNTTLTLPADLRLLPGSYTWTVSLPPGKPAAIQPPRALVVTTFTVPAGT